MSTSKSPLMMSEIKSTTKSEFGNNRGKLNEREWMRKNNRLQIFADTKSQPQKTRFTEALREWIGLIGAGTGIFSALLYLAGRSFASGYFEAMNIPHYMVTFSIWEYGEVGWFPMLVFPAGMMLIGGIFWTIVYGLGSWLSPLAFAVGKWLGKWIKIKPPAWKLPEFSFQTRIAWKLTSFMVSILIFIFFVGFALQYIQDRGAENGQLVVLEKAAKVELVSAVPMTLDNPSLVTSQAGQNGNQFYAYKGFHLLTVNGGKYYLFKEIDPVTCKPLQIYVIDADQYNQVNLWAAESLSSQCLKKTNPIYPSAPTIMPTSTP
jgi:hypothetical protein